jgi:hypothetical protein
MSDSINAIKYKYLAIFASAGGRRGLKFEKREI